MAATPDLPATAEAASLPAAAANVVSKAMEEARSLTSRSPGEVVGVGHSIEDAEWSRFERTTFILAELVERRPLAEDLMFRNVNLNPGDTYIPSSVRNDLSGLLKRFSAELEELDRIKGEHATREFGELRNRGAVRSEPLGAYKDRLSPDERRVAEATEEWMLKKMAERSGRPVDEVRRDASTAMFVPDLMFKGKERPVAWSHSDGQLQSATERDMPVTASVLESIDFLTIECAAAVCGWVSASGAIDPSESRRLLQEFGESQKRRKQ